MSFWLVVVAMVAPLVALGVSLRENSKLRTELANIGKTADSAEAMTHHQQKLLTDARLGSTLLYRMASSDRHEEIIEFLREIPAASLSCRTMDLPEYPTVKLISFHHHRENPDGSLLPIDECKSASILVNSESLEILDYNLHRGFSSISKSSIAPFYVLCRDQPDGSSIKYTILPTGFELTK